jgi:PKD repeat protein
MTNEYPGWKSHKADGKHSIRIFKAAIISLLFIVVLPPSSNSQESTGDNSYLLVDDHYMEPYTFDYALVNGETILGIVWVDRSLNNTEAISFKTYDGVDFSDKIQISQSSNPGTYHSPTACVCGDLVVFMWIQMINETLVDIHMRQSRPVLGLGPIIDLMKNVYLWRDVKFYYNDYYTYFGTIRPIYYHNSLIILYTQAGAVYYAKYDFKTEAISSTDYILWAFGVNLFEHRDKLFICYDQAQGPGQYFYRCLMELNTIDPINMSEDLSLLLDLACYYPYGDMVFSFNDRMLFNQPHPYYFSPDWIINSYDYQTQIMNTTKIIDSPKNLSKTTLYAYDGTIHIAYIDNSTETYDKLYYMSLANDNLTKPILLSNRFKCDYLLDPHDIRSKTYLSLHMITTKEEKTLCAVWISKDDAHDGIYILHLMKIGTEYIFKPSLSVTKEAVYTNESETFIGEIVAEHHIYEFLFDFGDGTTTGWTDNTIVDHAYRQNGIYSVRLKARNELGIESNWTSRDIVVVNRHPIINATINKDTVMTNEDIQFSSDGTYDLDGSIIKTIWELGDGNTSLENNVIHNYSTEGIYDVKFTATDDDYDTGSQSFIITVLNRAPLVNGSVHGDDFKTGDDVVFTSDGSLDPDGNIVNYQWDFGDGTGSNEKNPTHNYSRSGIYNVSLIVTDNKNSSTTTTFMVYIKNRPPVASLYIAPIAGTIFTDFAFSSRCNDPDGVITDYAWDFGDGETSNMTSPTHRYGAKGTFWISLQVTDDANLKSDIVRMKVLVENIAPTGSILVLSKNNQTFEPVEFKANCSDPDGKLVLYIWDFGDGYFGMGQNVSHQYTDDGIYNASLRSIDDSFGENISTVNIIIANRAPIIVLKYKEKAMTGDRLTMDASGSWDKDGRISKIRWFFDDNALDGMTVNYTFKSSGEYVVKVIIQDDDGAISERSFNITVLAKTTNRDYTPWIIVVGMFIVLIVCIFILWRHRTHE